MTKKDYIAVARILKDRRPLYDGNREMAKAVCQAANDTLDGIASDLCEVFIQDNPRFDRQSFIDACNL